MTQHAQRSVRFVSSRNSTVTFSLSLAALAEELGFRIQRKTRGDGRQVVLTIPSKQALAAVMRKIKQATSRYTTSLRLQDVLWVVNPILRGWAAYFRYGAAKRTFSYLAHWAWWRLIYWLRRKHPKLSWKQLRRRWFGPDEFSGRRTRRSAP